MRRTLSSSSPSDAITCTTAGMNPLAARSKAACASCSLLRK